MRRLSARLPNTSTKHQLIMNNQPSEESNPRISIVILNWNNYEDTKECLNSICEQDYENIDVILVDNGSEDGSFSRLLSKFDVYGVKLSENTGFPAGNNVGIRAAIDQGTDYILLLNNDTILPSGDTVRNLIKSAASRDNLGILSPLILHYPETEKVWFANGSINPITGENIHTHRGKDIDEVELPNTIENDRVTGCAMLVPTNIFEEVGFLDPKYFLLESDTDFSLRVQNAGYQLLTDTSIKIYHKVSASSGPQFSLSYYSSRNRWRLINKLSNFYPTANIFFLLGLARAVKRRVQTRNFQYITDLFKGVCDGIIGEFGAKDD